MLERILEYSHLGTSKQINFIINRLLKSPITYSNLKKICLDNDYSFFQSFDGIVNLFEYLKIITKENNLIQLDIKVSKNNFNQLLLKKIFKVLSQVKELHNLFSTQSIIIYSNKIYIRFIPLKFSSIRNLLLNLKFLSKDTLIPNQFIITKPYLDFFKTETIPLIESSHIKNNSLSKFHVIQKIKEVDGDNAERFVLEYEKNIRKNHKNFNNIKIISKLDTSAGYDIASYLSDESIILDKFIGVKSYSKDNDFYWSLNEVKRAKEEKSNYFLYLVDKNQITNKSYIPTIIKNPYQIIFKNHKRECQNWKFKIPITEDKFKRGIQD